MRTTTIRHRLAAAACVVAALGIASCGGDDEGGTSTAAGTPDVARYCELVTELDRISTEIFNQLAASGTPTDKQLAAAQLQILEENQDLISEMEQVVPDEIREDFQLSEQSARQRAEAASTEAPPKDVIAANLRLRKFRAANCSGGPTGSG